MKIICITTNESHHGLLNWLEPSCAFHDLEFVLLNYGEKYHSHKMKDFILLEYLKKSNDNEIILFTDAYDTLMLAGEQELMAKYRSFDAPLVFSAEINCWPDTAMEANYPAETSSRVFKYLNSGGFIGESRNIAGLIEKYYNGNEIDHSVHQWSNQYVWHQIYLKEQENIRLDHNGDIFYTLSSIIPISRTFAYHPDETVKARALEADKDRILKEIVLENGRVHSRLTGTSPAHLHFSSPTTKHLMLTPFFDALRPWQADAVHVTPS